VALPAPPEMEDSAILGSTNAHLIIDRLSPGAEVLLGYSSGGLIGQSLLELVSGADVLGLVTAAARSLETGSWTSLSVSVQRKEESMRRRLVLAPVRPAPSLMFALTNDSAGPQPLCLRDGSSAVRASPAAPVGPSRQSTLYANVPGLVQLSAREVEIVSRLFNGDRVPAIADSLFLSQSTVRNHLSAVFRKLGVRSQQELIYVLREALPASDAPPAIDPSTARCRGARCCVHGGEDEKRPSRNRDTGRW
jgi:DNA-binding CsgD family transcriptional regulator